jgi:hypothetical protein
MPVPGDGWTYRLRYVRCGKEGCHCNYDAGHGPYWYAYRHRQGRMYHRYCGKNPFYGRGGPTPEPEPAYAHAEPSREDRWRFNGRMDLKTALRIMAFSSPPGPDELLKRWRVLIGEHHPDRGGETRVAAAINAAYAYLRR